MCKKPIVFLMVLFLMSLTQAIQVKNGATNVTTYFVMRDQTAGTVDDGVVLANMDLYYLEDGAAPSAKRDANDLGGAAVAHDDWEVYDCNLGSYRVDWPDAAFDGGIGKRVQLYVVDGDGGAFTEIMEVELSAPVDIVAVHGDAIPDPCNSGYLMVDTVYTKWTTPLDAAATATAIWNAATGSYGGAGTYGQAVEDVLTDTSTTLDNLVDDLETRLTAARAGYLDNLNGHTAQTGDSYAIVSHVTYGNSAIETLVDENESLLKNATYGLSALKTLIDAIEAGSGATAEELWQYDISDEDTAGSAAQYLKLAGHL